MYNLYTHSVDWNNVDKLHIIKDNRYIIIDHILSLIPPK